MSGCGKHERESKSVSCVFISRFISAVRVVGGDMSKLAVWILPQKAGVCATAPLLLHTEMFPPWSLCVSVESFAVRRSSECRWGRCHVVFSFACHHLGGYWITGSDEEQLS